MARCYKCGKSEIAMKCICEECAQDKTIDKVIAVIDDKIKEVHKNEEFAKTLFWKDQRAYFDTIDAEMRILEEIKGKIRGIK